MNIIIKKDCSNINWKEVRNIIKTVGMSYVDEEIHKKSFENSYTVVFIFDNEKLIGFGRAISDGVRQSSIYDVAILPEYQGFGVGKLIIENIINNTPTCNFILYASPGKEGFYESLGFRKLKTGMGLFIAMERMKSRNFIE
ncbi:MULTISPECIES: GNAT family N-acetyltransferase [unclassified Clostridium]|uniref:GNAT family N-acetyltransferase n=1 Tax=unclassified Clostridium TaxID=2614128 RepID=UPI00290F92F0|nr:GNAT family N-acetyltransferase [Clostridium sp.]MDU5107016.1 GNAT family N-acetyltransferase [Clostridium sp.]